VLATNGNFYGTTFGNEDTSDCASTCSTVFEMTPAGELTTIYTFCTQANCADGDGASGLLQARNGSLYGATYGGVHNPGCPPYDGCGTIFEITPAGKFTTIYTFCAQTSCADGTNAYSLLQATDGNFYGTADSFVGQ
ncbi:MAG: choice-of-anchor tandem repeat GloVer-containing protein, partial [Candidatus Sulfotelmatobacter sp.]